MSDVDQDSQVGGTYYCEKCEQETYPLDCCKCPESPPQTPDAGGESPKGFISAPSIEDLKPTEAEKAKFAQLFAWAEASKYSDFRTGPNPDFKCPQCKSLQTQLDEARKEIEQLKTQLNYQRGSLD